MKTLAQVATTLRMQLERVGKTQEALGQEAGISRQTLSKVLSGRADFKVTTLLALADRLGLELVLLPKEIARGMDQAEEPAAVVKSRVQAALENVRRHRGDGPK